MGRHVEVLPLFRLAVEDIQPSFFLLAFALVGEFRVNGVWLGGVVDLDWIGQEPIEVGAVPAGDDERRLGQAGLRAAFKGRRHVAVVHVGPQAPHGTDLPGQIVAGLVGAVAEPRADAKERVGFF